VSADNWSTCPACWTRATEEHERRANEVQAMYGVATVEEFDAARAQLEKDRPREDEHMTLREDYEWWVNQPALVIEGDYKCQCTACGYGTTCEVRYPLPPVSSTQGGSE
jgi:hypothetical protein